jgi:hypothetical protein
VATKAPDDDVEDAAGAVPDDAPDDASGDERDDQE